MPQEARALHRRGKLINMPQARTLAQLLLDPKPSVARPKGFPCGSRHARPLGVLALHPCVYLGCADRLRRPFSAKQSQFGKGLGQRWVSDGQRGALWADMERECRLYGDALLDHPTTLLVQDPVVVGFP